MKPKIKISLFTCLLTLFTHLSFGRVVGSLINSMPTVTLITQEFQDQLNDLEASGFTDVQLTDIHLTYDGAMGGSLYYTISYNPPYSSVRYQTVTELSCIFDPVTHQFTVPPGGGENYKTTCTSRNCKGCLPKGGVCTYCDVISILEETYCIKNVSNGIGPVWRDPLVHTLNRVSSWLSA